MLTIVNVFVTKEIRCRHLTFYSRASIVDVLFVFRKFHLHESIDFSYVNKKFSQSFALYTPVFRLLACKYPTSALDNSTISLLLAIFY